MDNTPNVGNDLVRIHKVITRALDVSIQNSRDLHISDDHRLGFSLYVRSLTVLLHAHHSGEDELAFPFWKTRFPAGPFDALIAQHREMITYLERLESWIEAGREAWQAARLEELHRALTSLQRLWESHIALEEETVGPEKSQQHLSPSENELLGRQLADHGQAHSQPAELVMPFIVFNLSPSDRAEFIKLLPPVVTSQLIPVAWKAAWEPMTPFLLAQ